MSTPKRSRSAAPAIAPASPPPHHAASDGEGRELADLANLPDLATAPGDLRTTRVTIGGETFVVVSHPVRRVADDVLARLSEAERAIVLRVIEGWSHAAIADERKTSPRTVGKQLESAYRRLGVSSRAELTALLSDPEP